MTSDNELQTAIVIADVTGKLTDKYNDLERTLESQLPIAV